MNDRRLGLILKRLGHVLHELGDFIVLAAQDEEHHERPTADIPAALPHCSRCGTQQICPKCDLRFTAGSPVDSDAPTERASEVVGVADRAKAEQQVSEIGRVLGIEFPDEDAPDLGQAPSNLGNGPVPLFIDGDEDPEDEVLVEPATEFEIGGDGRG